jgi:penicillin-binding protein 2
VAKINNGTEVTVRIPAVRGEIRDRRGVTLAGNRPSYTLEFYLQDLVRSYRDEHGKVPTTEYIGTVRGMKKVLREPDIVQIVNESVLPHLRTLGLAENYNAAQLVRHFRTQGEVPFAYREDLDADTLARIAASGIRVPGVAIVDRPLRQYPLGALGAHLLGYVGPIKDLSSQRDLHDFNFYDPDLEGKAQVERSCDRWLRGEPGARVLFRNARRVVEGEVRRVAPTPGRTVLLTIDVRLQTIVEQALRDAGVGRGAAVLIDPKNGDVLAMASVPSFDPNAFIPAVSEEDWEKLTADETDPLTNRAVQAYAPGSIYKTVTALAGLRAGFSATQKRLRCEGGVQYGGKYMKCWIAGCGTHGPLTLSDALEVSCNAFFYQWGNAAGIDQIAAVGEVLGLGRKTGIPVSGESGGVLPSPAWLKTTHPSERWSDGHTANVSIGQGYVLASPLQMAMVAAAIANRGVVFQPRLVHRVVDAQGNDAIDPDTGEVIAPFGSKVSYVLKQRSSRAAQIEAVREGMRRVVAEGTGRRAQISGVKVAGKTGTAQFWRNDIPDNHTWFIAFAPYDEPRFALCVLVQGAKSGGGVAAPIAQRILERSLALDQGNEPAVTALAPATGSFAQIEAVNYEEPPAARSATASTPSVRAVEIPKKPSPATETTRLARTTTATPIPQPPRTAGTTTSRSNAPARGLLVPFFDDSEKIDGPPPRQAATKPWRPPKPNVRPRPDTGGSP